MQPAEMVISKFGGQTALARLVGKGQSTVQHWAKTGCIPAKWQAELLRIAGEKGIDLAPADFVSINDASHVVQFYEDDAFLVDSVAQFVGSAFDTGNSAIVIATKAHRSGIAQCLKRRGFNLPGEAHQRTYTALDADGTLSKFIVDGRPDKRRFLQVIEPVVARANAVAKSGHPRAAVFGEMVVLLWASGNHAAAIELEQLWNDLAQRSSFRLCCGYPIKNFNREEYGQPFASICAQHIDVIPAESFSALAKEGERRRTVARLQQRVQALETEVRLGEERASVLQAVAGLGAWEINLANESISLSPKAQVMLGLKGQPRIPLPELLQRMRNSRDRDKFRAAVKKARRNRKEFVVQFKVQRKNRIIVLSSRGKTVYNAGQPLIVAALI